MDDFMERLKAVDKEITNKKMVPIGKFIKNGREKIYHGRGGISAAAKKYGTTSSTWGRWESGAAVPDDVNQRKLAKFFGVTLAELRGDHEKIPPDDSGGGEDLAEEITRLAEAHGAAGQLSAGVAAILRAIGDRELDPDIGRVAFDAALDALESAVATPPTLADAAPATPASPARTSTSS